MTIKQATINDAKTISQIHAKSWKVAYQKLIPQQYLDDLQDDFWVNTFQDWIGNNNVTAQIMYDGNLPIGCIAYGKSRDANLPDWGEIISIYFLPGYIGKQYGKELIDMALTDMHQLGIRDVYLWVLDRNERARKFYERNGFFYSKDTFSFEILGVLLTDVRYTIHMDNR